MDFAVGTHHGSPRPLGTEQERIHWDRIASCNGFYTEMHLCIGTWIELAVAIRNVNFGP